MNPYANEIDACTGLIRYLEEKTNAQKRDREKMEHDKKLAAFNPKEAAPSGFALPAEEDEWAFQDRTRQKQKQKAPVKKDTKGDGESKPRDKMITHSFDRLRSFELVGIDRPLTFSQIPKTIEAIRAKKKEYESHIKEGDDAVESSDEEEQEEAEAENTEAPAAATTEE